MTPRFIRTLAISFVFCLLSFSGFAQLEVSKSSNDLPTRSTRFRLAADNLGIGQTDASGNFQKFVWKSEALTRTLTVNTNGSDTLSPPSGPFVTIGTHPTSYRLGQKRFGFGSKFETYAFSSEVQTAYNLIAARVARVNGVSAANGDLALTTDDIPEGPNNKFMTTTGFAQFGDTRYATAQQLTTKADAVSVIPFVAVASYSNLSSITPPATGFFKFVRVDDDNRYGERNSIYLIDSFGSISKIPLLPKENATP